MPNLLPALNTICDIGLKLLGGAVIVVLTGAMVAGIRWATDRRKRYELHKAGHAKHRSTPLRWK